MTIDNVKLVAGFMPLEDDGDTFLYTELLDRRKRSGNNRGRIVKAFYHRSVDDFLGHQAQQIVDICEALKVRAYTRLQRRSFRLVGMTYVKIIVEQALTGNWQGMRHAYSKAAGTTPPLEKLWLFDVDHQDRTAETVAIETRPEFVVAVPSRKGRHLIVRPFDLRTIAYVYSGASEIQLHRDNPTNLFIPDGAA